MGDTYDNRTIFQFTGAEYASWATKVQYGLFQKRLIRSVMDFKGQRRVVCPDPIPPLAQGALALIFRSQIFFFNKNYFELFRVKSRLFTSGLSGLEIGTFSTISRV